MKKRITAAVMLAVMLMLLAPDVKTSAGLFGGSWFENPDGLYFKTNSLPNMIQGNPTVKVAGTASGKIFENLTSGGISVSYDLFMGFAYDVYQVYKQEQVTKGYLTDDEIPLLYDKDTGDASGIDNDMLDRNSKLSNLIPLAEKIYPLFCAVTRMSDAVDKYNGLGDADRPARFKELYDTINVLHDRYGSSGTVTEGIGKDMKKMVDTFKANNWQDSLNWWKKAWDEDRDNFRNNEETITKFENDWNDTYERTVLTGFYSELFQHFIFDKDNNGKNYFSNTPDMELEAWNSAVEALMECIDDLYGQMEEVYNQNITVMQNISPATSVGTIEENISKMLCSLGEGASGLLSENQLVIEHIVYGRVQAKNHQNGGTVNNFSFELATGNVYGVTGAFMYSVLRGTLFLGILLFFMYYLAKDSLTASVKARSKLKDNVGYVLLAITLMFAMPNIIDLIIKVRDIILQTLGNNIVKSGAAGINGLESDFKSRALNGYRLIDALQYLGIVFVTLYLGFVYIGMACSFTIMFAGFPIFLIVSFRDHKVLNEWVTFCIGVIITPLIDAVLFLIPIIASDVGGSNMPSFIKLLLCISIIPSRSAIKRMLGFANSIGSEMLGVGAMMAAGRAMGTVAGTVKNTTGRVIKGTKGTVEDARNARMYKKMDDLETEDRERKESSEGAYAAGEDTSGRTSESLERTKEAFGDEPAFEKTVNSLKEEDRAGSVTGMSGNDAAESAAGAADNLKGMEKVTGQDGRQGTGAGDADPRAAAVLRSGARMGNFENMKGLDSATKAKMYRNRAICRGARTLLGTAGSIQGSIAGAAIGGGATLFMGSNAMMMGMSAGYGTGSEIGALAGEAAAAVGRGAGAGVRKGYSVASDAVGEIRSGGLAGVAASSMTFDAMRGRYGTYDENQSEIYNMVQNLGAEIGQDPALYSMFTDENGIDLKGGNLLNALAMSRDDADGLGYTSYIDNRFSNVSSEEEAFDIVKEAGMLGAYMQGPDSDGSYDGSYISSYIPDTDKSAICHSIRANVGRLATATGDDGNLLYPNLNRAYTGATYIDSTGRSHTGSEGYFGAGFDSYRDGGNGAPVGSTPTPPTGFNPRPEDKAEESIRMLMEKTGKTREQVEALRNS